MDHANIQSEIIIKQTKIIEQLEKEKEWLLKAWAINRNVYEKDHSIEEYKALIMVKMQQALKEG